MSRRCSNGWKAWRTRLNPIPFHELRTAGGSDHNVRSANNIGHVLGPRVYDSDSRVVPQQQLGHRRADNLAAADDDAIAARDLDAGLLYKFEAAIGRARQKASQTIDLSMEELAGVQIGQTATSHELLLVYDEDVTQQQRNSEQDGTRLTRRCPCQVILS